jgi:hypothetical protein
MARFPELGLEEGLDVHALQHKKTGQRPVFSYVVVVAVLTLVEKIPDPELHLPT